ncbi:hypothetical protein FRB91_004458 [Serendipita sp. 411]|nr:hypothetical protein FRB91_004458 [Serendipita sp. 411]
MTFTVELKATESKVHAVTVFQADRAEVVRLFKVDLKSGQNEVDISQLPTVLDEDSIRVDGVGGNAIISDVIYHPPTSSDSDRKHEEAVKELQQAKSVLEQELAIYRKQEDILKTYSETLKGADTDGAKLSDFLDIYAKRQTGIDGKVRELKEQVNEINEKIKKEGELWSADKEGKKRATRVTIVVSAEHDGEAEICLTYSALRLFMIFVANTDLTFTSYSGFQCILEAPLRSPSDCRSNKDVNRPALSSEYHPEYRRRLERGGTHFIDCVSSTREHNSVSQTTVGESRI